MARLRTLGWGLGLTILVAACASLPSGAADAVLHTYAPDEQASIFASKKGALLEEDRQAGAEEVWCVQVSHLCYDCARQQLKTCVSGRLARLIRGAWSVEFVMDSEDIEAWRRRGCPEIESVVADSPFGMP